MIWQFKIEKHKQLYDHILKFNHHHPDTAIHQLPLSCDDCSIGQEIVAKGIGIFLRTLLEGEERKFQGCSAAAVAQGRTTVNTALDLLTITPYENTNTDSNDLAYKRLLGAVTQDFPGLDISRHLGNDLPVHVGNLIPFLQAASTPYSVLKKLYNTVFLRRKHSLTWKKIEINFDLASLLTICWHVNSLLTLNPNSVVHLWTSHLVCDAFVYSHLNKKWTIQKDGMTQSQPDMMAGFSPTPTLKQ